MSARAVLLLALAALAVFLAFREQPDLLDTGGDVIYFDDLNWLAAR